MRILSKLSPTAWYLVAALAMGGLFAAAGVAGQAYALGFLLAGVAAGLAFVSIGWVRSDETAKEAHKVAWWHGANMGLLVAVMVCLALPYAPAINEFIVGLASARPLGQPIQVAFALGVMFVALLQASLYGMIWAGWWVTKR